MDEPFQETSLNLSEKTALTTQGIGVVFKRDFDSVFSFLRPIIRKLEGKKPEPADTIPTDSVAP